MTIIPLVYPHGGPLFWRNEESGVLADAVQTYLLNRTRRVPISPAQVELVRAYLRHWINAPCWSHGDEGIAKEFEALQRSVETLGNADDIDRWIHAALDLGIDPL